MHPRKPSKHMLSGVVVNASSKATLIHWLDEYEFVSDADKDGNNALHALAKAAYWLSDADTAEVLTLFINNHYQLDVNAKNKAGETPLFLAVRNYRFQTAELLLQHQAKVESHDPLLKTLLSNVATSYYMRLVDLSESAGEHRQSVKADVAVLEKIIQAIFSQIDIQLKDEKGNNLLQQSILSDNYHLAYTTIMGGVDVNHVNDEGMSALMMAANAGNMDLMLLLLANKANMNGPLTFNGFAGSIVFNDSVEIFSCALFDIINAPDTIKLQKLEELIAYIDNIDRNNPSYNFKRKVFDRYDAAGLTVLHLATRKCSPVFIGLLIAAGADINKWCCSGMKPVFMLLTRSDSNDISEIIQLYANTGKLNINDTGEKQRTLLHACVIRNDCDLIRLLLWLKAAVDKGDSDGNTAMHLACYHAQPETLKILLDAGASPFRKNHGDSRPLDFAVYGHLEQQSIMTTEASDLTRNHIAARYHKAKMASYCRVIETMLDAGAGICVNIHSMPEGVKLDNKLVIDLKIITYEPVNRSTPGFSNAICTRDEWKQAIKLGAAFERARLIRLFSMRLADEEEAVNHAVLKQLRADAYQLSSHSLVNTCFNFLNQPTSTAIRHAGRRYLPEELTDKLIPDEHIITERASP